MAEHSFQVNLRGLVEVLSHHLYASPAVYVRELLQNAVDAVSARRAAEPGFGGQVELEARGGPAPTLVVADDGIGLTERELHELLATIGETSKRPEGERPTDFIGRFGIGLLACFMVADELTVVTRSATAPDAPTLRWVGRADGSYQVGPASTRRAPGTSMFLRARPDAAELLLPGRVLELARRYGALLPVPVRLDDGERVHEVNDRPPPWALVAPSLEAQRAAAVRLCLDSFGFEPLDVVPLAAPGLRGMAFVLPAAPSPAARQGHRVYLRRMLLGEAVDGLLPDWAFLFRCVVDADDLNPTAARDGLRHDDRLAEARTALGHCLRDHLVALARTDPDRLAAIVAVHHLAITALARHDDDCLALFAEWLPLETSLGRMTLGEHRRRFELLRYVRRVDDFRQLAPLAGAQGRSVVNAGYLNLAELLERLPAVRPDLATAELDATEVLDTFDDLTLAQRAEVRALVDLAALALQPFGCAVEVRAFAPDRVPAIYVQSEAGRTRRQLGRGRAVAGADWAGVLDVLAGTLPASPAARLCLNQRNRAVRALAARAGPGDATAVAAVGLLYVQALLLGHHALDEAELALLDEAVYGLVT